MEAVVSAALLFLELSLLTQCAGLVYILLCRYRLSVIDTLLIESPSKSMI